MTRALLILLATLPLAACGKSNAPSPPPGEEAAYVYPQTYPAPRPAGEAPDWSGPPVLRHIFGSCEEE